MGGGPTWTDAAGSIGSRPPTDGSPIPRLTDLPADDAIDRDLLIGELEVARFADTELREEAWDPLWWIYLAGDGFFPLLARLRAWPIG